MLEGKSILAIIPARGGSKGVVKKNLRVVGGKSLIRRTIEAAKASSFLDRIIVSSDDANIISEALSSGADVPFVRPAQLADDFTPAHEVVLHALKQLPHYDYFMLLQPTSPLRTANDIDQCINLCFQKNAPSCVSVCEAQANPYWMYYVENHKLSPVMNGPIPLRRQDLPFIYQLNGAIYLAQTEWFLREKNFLSEQTVGFVMPQDRSLDIDTEMDLLILETILKKTQELEHEKA